MSKYTASLVAQNTNVYLFTVHKPTNGSDACTFTVLGTGTFGGGTVTVSISPDSGTTLIPLAPITGTASTFTVASALTYKVGNGDKNNDAPMIYASIATATTPNVSLIAYDNN